MGILSDISVWNFNETLTNDVVRFEQPGPEKQEGNGQWSDTNFLSLWEMARYRVKYCLKGPLNPKKQPTKFKQIILNSQWQIL